MREGCQNMKKNMVIGLLILSTCISVTINAASDNLKADPITLLTGNLNSAILSSETYNEQGLYYAKIGNMDQAEVNFLQALKLTQDKNKQDVYTNNLAMTYKNQGRYELALKMINTVLEHNPVFVDALDTKGDILISLHQYEEAERLLTEAILLNPREGTSYYNRGRAYEAMAKIENALQDYREAIELPGAYREESEDKVKQLKI